MFITRAYYEINNSISSKHSIYRYDHATHAAQPFTLNILTTDQLTGEQSTHYGYIRSMSERRGSRHTRTRTDIHAHARVSVRVISDYTSARAEITKVSQVDPRSWSTCPGK